MEKAPKPVFRDAPVPIPNPPRPLFVERTGGPPALRPVFPPAAAPVAPSKGTRAPAPLFTEGGGLAPDLLAALDAATANDGDAWGGDDRASRRSLARVATELAAVPPTDAAAFMAFGTEAQARVTALPDAMLALSTEREDGIAAALTEVVASVRSVNAEDLLPTGIGALLLRRLAPPEERLRNAVAAVEIAIGRARAGLPVAEARHERVLSLLRDEAVARRDLLIHVRAAEAVLACRAGADRAGSAEYGLTSLERRLISLRVTLNASAGDVTRLGLLRDADARLIGAARSDIPELVAAWKRGCATVLIRFAARDGAALGAAVRDLGAARDRLVGAIEMAVVPPDPLP